MRDSDKQGCFECPNCGAVVRRGASACPECGSDERTGWSAQAEYGSEDYPAGYGEDADFNYKEFVRREFGGRPEGSPTLLTRANLVAAVSILLAAALVWLWVF